MNPNNTFECDITLDSCSSNVFFPSEIWFEIISFLRFELRLLAPLRATCLMLYVLVNSCRFISFSNRHRFGRELLGVFTNITSLDLSYQSPDHFYHISCDVVTKLTKLTKLGLYNNTVIHSIDLPVSITHLDIGCFNTTLDGCCLSVLTNLKVLELSLNSKITNEHISNLTSITQLRVACNNIIDDVGLYNLTNLTSLDMVYSKITGSVFYRLGSTLNHLKLAYTENLDRKALVSLPGLKTLEIHDAKNLSCDTLSILTSLEALTIIGGTIISMDNLTKLSNLHSIELRDDSDT